MGFDGFISDPESEYAMYAPQVLVTLQVLQSERCLVLLGEPGMGKTTTLQELTEIPLPDRDRRVMDLLRDCGSDYRLDQELFASDWFALWEAGDGQLELVLDSLDEARIGFPAIDSILARKLQFKDIARLTLRLYCRTAEWPEPLAADLATLWGLQQVPIYELAPLRRKDVAAEAELHGLHPQRFLEAVIERDVQAFAARPITLNLLMRTFKRDGQLPDRIADIYEAGLPLICDETPGRQRLRLENRLTGIEQVAVASRIAGALVLSNRSIVRLEVEVGDPDDAEVPVTDLLGYTEPTESGEVAVTERTLIETLGSGLFADAGPARRTLAHKTYTEFLVARYLHRGHFTKRQIYNLISVPGEPAPTIPPQLEEIAAWLASMDPDVLADILSAQPELLVRGDIATLDPTTRLRITDALLMRAGSRAILAWHPLRQHLRKLNHPNLVDQLQPHIRSKGGSEELRTMAIEIARACSCQILSNDLVAVALDQAEPYQLRIRAADAVAEIGTIGARVYLKPLARSEAGDDPDDELRGYALEALWPAHLSAKELFDCLGRQRNDHFVGSYARFLRFGDFADSLQPSDLPEALRWVERQNITIFPTDDLRNPANTIVIAAWDHLVDNEILTSLAGTFWARLRMHDNLAFGSRHERDELQERLRTDAAKRRGMLKMMIRIAGSSDHISSLRWSAPNLVRPEDFGWIVFECLYGAPSEAARWAELALHTFDSMNRDEFELAYRVHGLSPWLKSGLGSWFSPVMLNSREANLARRSYRRQRRKEAASKPTLDPPPEARVRQTVSRALTNDPRFWPRLLLDMSLDANSTRYTFLSNPLASPGWKNADPATRRRIVEAAYRFLREVPPDETWIATDRCTFDQFAAFPALWLLVEEGVPASTDLNDEVWVKWAPSILAFLTSGEDQDARRMHRFLIRQAYGVAPEQILSTLKLILYQEDASHGHLSVLDRVADCSDQRMLSALLALTGDRTLSAKATGTLLRVLLRHDMPAARALATSLVLCAGDDGERARSIQAAAALLDADVRTGWQLFWSVAKRDAAWSTSVVEMVATGSLNASFLRQSAESEIGELLDWMLTRYSPNEDPSQTTGFMGADDQVRRWRDSLLMRLRDWGSAAALAEIRRLRAAHPELAWLDWTESAAKRAHHSRVWRPVNPREIVQMSTSAANRIVETEGQLLEVLCESLGRLQEKLQGTPGRARLLWDTRVRRPKAEEDLSDFIVEHLKEDLVTRGVILGREVRIRRRNWSGGQPAQIVDIHAAALAGRTHQDDPLIVIIEIKGCWNRDLRTAMETQLLSRYLTASQGQYGLYVVGWFLCEYWDSTHDQKGDAARLFSAIVDCREYLDAQARQLSAQLAGGSGRVYACVLDMTLQ